MPTAVLKTPITDEVVTKVREALRRQQYRPFELMHYLEETYDFDDSAVREAVWKLLCRFEVEFTEDQKLSLRSKAQRPAHR